MNFLGRYEIRISGFGGQGIILMGKILGTASAIHHHRNATLMQAYGPETRGSACRADLIVSADSVDYPYINRPGLLIVLSQDAYTKFRRSIAPGGIIIYDCDLVQLDEKDQQIVRAQNDGIHATDNPLLVPVPAMSIAEQTGTRIMTNMAMVGFVVALTELISLEALEAVVSEMVPPSTTAANLGTVRKGYERGLEWKKNLAALGFENAKPEASLIPCAAL